MKFRTRIAMKSNPTFGGRVTLDPVGVQGTLSGSGKAKIEPISLAVSAIPVRLAIPFLKRRRSPLLGTIGGFGIRLSAIQISSEGMSLKLEGVVGSEGLHAGLEGQVGCETEMHVDGTMAGQLGTIVKMGPEEREEEHEEEHHEGHREGHHEEHGAEHREEDRRRAKE